MSEAGVRLSQREANENAFGVVLGYWDHEKTQTLIRDLEKSISLAEFKCKKLLEELTYFKKYLEKPGETDFHLTVIKRKSKDSKNYLFLSGSEPEIAFRKNFINFQKEKKIFEEKFQEKLKNINKELTKAAHKIGLKDNIILFPTKEHSEKFRGETEDQKELERNAEEKKKEEEGEVKKKFFELTTIGGKTKSDSVIINNIGNPDFSKITKNQLELYQKLSRWSMKKKCMKRLNRKSCKRNKAKYVFNRKVLKYLQHCKTLRYVSKKPKPLKKRSNKRKNRKTMPQARKCRLFRVPSLTSYSRDSENVIMCPTLIDGFVMDSHKSCDEPNWKPRNKDTSLSRGYLKSALPFTACTSSDCHKAIKKMETKHGKKVNVRISASEKMHENTRRKQNVGSLTPKSSLDNVNKRPNTPWTHSQTKNISFENKKHRGNTWISSKIRRVRSKNRQESPKNFVKYKSTTSQFVNCEKSMIQSESKRAFTVGSKIMLSDCQRANIILTGKNANSFKNASGDGKGNDKYAELNREWEKVYVSFLKIYRKYMGLKKKVSDNNLALADEDLISLEKDIDCSMAKYKEFLEFYTKFLHMNHGLKAVKFAWNTKTVEPVGLFTSFPQRNILSYKRTNSMAMKEALREVQALQDKINLVYD